jgi:hypothetical protein
LEFSVTAIQQRLFLQQLSLESVNLAVELFLQSPNCYLTLIQDELTLSELSSETG